MATTCSGRKFWLIVTVVLASYLTSMVEGTRHWSFRHSSRKLQIAIPIFENMTMLDVAGPYEILNTLPFANVTFVSFKRGLISDLGTMSIEAKATFDEIQCPDVVIVPGGVGVYNVINNTIILDWIRKTHKTTIYTTSVCTGAALLGAAGLLEGIDATTHWSSFTLLTLYGANPVSRRVVKSGKIITSAGVTSGIDMAITLVALLTDKFTAQVTQLFNEYDPQPPFNTGTKSKASPELIAKVFEWSEKLQDKLLGKS